MNLKRISTSRIVDATKKEEEAYKLKIYEMINKFVLKYHEHFYPHYKGDVYDLTLDIFTNYCAPKKHRNGEVFSELDRFDASKVGGGNWTGTEDQALATYVQRYVKNRLIDMERTDHQEVNATETFDPNNPSLTLDRAARGGRKSSEESEDGIVGSSSGAFTANDPSVVGLSGQSASNLAGVLSLLDDEDNWYRARDIFDEMSDEDKAHVARMYKLYRSKESDLHPKIIEFMDDLLKNYDGASKTKSTPTQKATSAKSNDTLASAPNATIVNYKLQGRPAVKVVFADKAAREAADFSAIVSEMESRGCELYKPVGAAIYFFKNSTADSVYVTVDTTGNAKKIRDASACKSELVYGPYPNRVANQVVDQLQTVKVGDTEIPKIKGSADLYKFAEQLGLDYLKSNGKPKSTDEIKSLIAEYLWNEEHPGEEMPPQIAPQLINDITPKGKEYVESTFNKDEWYLQNKINGMRFILVLNPDGSTHMTSRDRSVKTFRYSELDDRVLGLQNLTSPFQKRTILDGEIICDNPTVTLPSGVTTTSTLQSTVALMHMKPTESLKIQKEIGSLTYKVFDIIEYNGRKVEDMPYEDRAEFALQACEAINKVNKDSAIEALPVIKEYSSAWDEFEKYVGTGGEGLILKNRKAKYEQGKRTKGQWKLKGFVGVDAYVTGFTPSSDDKQFKDLIGGLTFSTNYKGKEIEIAAVSNIPLDVRKEATSHDADGNVILNPAWYGKCAELVGQNFKEGSFRLGSARINEWRPDKQPSDCQLLESQIRYDR